MSPKLPRITATDLLRVLHRNGWVDVRQRGSHLKLQHPARPGTLVVPVHAGAIIKPKTLQTILDQVGLDADELIELL